MTKKILDHIGCGMSIGFFCTTACMWIFGAYEADGFTVMRLFTVWMAASAMYGIVSLIYDADLPLPLSIMIHFAACLAVTVAASFVSGFMSIIRMGEWFVYVLPTFIIIYIIIGISTTVAAKYQVKKINRKIGRQDIG